MKIYLTILILALSRLCFADGIDKVDISLNGQFIISTKDINQDKLLVIDSLEVGDTLKFYAWTDWGGLDEAKLDVEIGRQPETIRIDKYPDRKYGATFYFVVQQNQLNKDLEFILNYNPSTKIEPWHFVTIAKETATNKK